MPIPKEINKYEAKLVANFTTRQTVSLAIAGACSIGVYNLFKLFALQDIAIYICAIIVVPILLCGFYKPYGMPFEVFAKIIFRLNFLAPPRRKYKIENIYDQYKEPPQQKTKYKKSKEAFF